MCVSEPVITCVKMNFVWDGVRLYTFPECNFVLLIAADKQEITKHPILSCVTRSLAGSAHPIPPTVSGGAKTGRALVTW